MKSIDNIKHYLNIKKRRNLILRVNYLKGLTSEMEEVNQLKKEQSLSRVLKYKQEDLDKANNYKNNQIIREEQIIKMDQRLEKEFKKKRYYLKKSLIKQNLPFEDQVNELRKTIDLKKNNELMLINEKNPLLTLDKDDLEKIDSMKKEIELKTSNQVRKIEDKHSKISLSNKIKVENLTKKIGLIEEKINNLTSNIDDFESNKLISEVSKIDELNSKLVDESVKHNDKKLQKINYELNRVNALKFLNENREYQLSLTNLKMYFGGIRAVNDLSFYVKKGEIFGLIGPNGAGKTTVFNCITQFYKPTSGNINFRNKEGNIVDLTTLKTHDIIKEGIARSFQNVELIWELTVLDNLMVSAHSLLVTNIFDHMFHTTKMKREEHIIRQKGIKLLQSLGILEYAFRSPYGLPYGVLKKIELARTLMTNPEMIILDEPAAGLNDAETKDLALVIKKINEDLGVTIFLVEHDMGLVMSICDTICAISFGKMLAIGTPKEIQNDPEVRKAYLGDDNDE